MGHAETVRLGFSACVLAAAAVTLTATGLVHGQQQPPTQPTTTSQPRQQAGDTIILIDRFHLVFQVGSPTGEPAEVQSIRMLGKPPAGVAATDADSYQLSTADIANAPITLGVVDGAFVSPDQTSETVRVRLKDLNRAKPTPYRVSAVASILKQTADYLNSLGLIAVLPHVDPEQIQEVSTDGGPSEFRDLRQGGEKGLNLVLQLGVVTGVRTIASGERVSTESRVNAPEHERIRYGSPVWPAESSKQAARRDVVRKDLLDEYVFGLNRYPGRRVDVAVSQAEVPGGIILDYLVSETKPWTIYAQASNTGTEQTSEWRQRFGFIHNQLTGNDDILTLDYITASFDDDSQAVIGSYEFPIPGLERLRGRVFGSYSSFTASDVGQQGDDFTGHQSAGGAELIVNLWQRRDWFLDVFGGGRVEDITVTNRSGGLTVTDADAVVWLPYVGARVERVTDTTSFATSATVEYGAADSGSGPLDALGRTNAAGDWTTLEVAASYSFYLEPLLFPSRFKGQRDEGLPQPKLAHEVAVSARGQTSFGERLIPQHQEVAGGLYSVRGYPESATAGDDVVIASAEYRFHLPRALDIQPTPRHVFGRPFRVAPDRALGRPDWDLVFKGFVDGAQVVNQSPESFEQGDETLVGTGVGLELQVLQNFNFQVYWGLALTDVESADWQAGDNRFHFVFTALY